MLTLTTNAAQAIPEGRPDQNRVSVSTRTGDENHDRAYNRSWL